MTSAYNQSWVYNLAVLKEAKRWCKHGFIDTQQLANIAEAYKCPFYHPNFMMRVLLFIVSLIAVGSITGLLFVFVVDVGKEALAIAAVVYGLIAFLILEFAFIKNNHFKSGVTEAILYHACGFVIAGFSDFDEHVILWVCLVVFSFAAIRYLDLICTLAATLTFAGLLFYEFYSIGGIFQQIIPFVFIFCFTPIYLFVKKLKRGSKLKLWRDNLFLIESISLLLVYAGGNYLIVRELSVSLMRLGIEPGEDIPFALLFYALTVVIPIVYLFFGIKNKDIVLLRISLIVLAFSVFTFKYYYSLGHHEVTLTVAGAILLAISIALINYLKIMRGGFTRENLLAEKWANLNVEGFIVSQTMGGNQAATGTLVKGGGGEFGGGGASGDF